MREKFWSMYEETLEAKYYYWHCRARAIFWDNTINCFSCAVSLTGISSWMIWEHFRWIWAAIIAVAQLLSAIRHLLPFSGQVTAVNLLLPELQYLLNDIDHEWDSIDEVSNERISDLVFGHRNAFTDIEKKYVGNVNFSRNKRCHKKAIAERKAFFFQHYGITKLIEMEGDHESNIKSESY